MSQKVLILGAGRSGVGSAELLLKHDADIVLLDANESLDIPALLERFDISVRERVRVARELDSELMDWAELAVLSPGIPIDHEWVIALEQADIPVWGEIELGFRYSRGDVLAITGTNGKTTTTTLLGEIMRAAGRETFVVGNIGKA